MCAFRGPNSDVTGYKAAQVPKSLWSVFRSDESPSLGDKLPSLFGYAYNEWLPSSGYIRANGPEMEFYYTLDNGLHAEEAWIPVKKA
ncbi:MAG: GyrI-like domain-containing protein [Clostridiales bacterium]|nr:GyrI-like domain-containing protein [Clostridiales bacterium]